MWFLLWCFQNLPELVAVCALLGGGYRAVKHVAGKVECFTTDVSRLITQQAELMQLQGQLILVLRQMLEDKNAKVRTVGA